MSDNNLEFDDVKITSLNRIVGILKKCHIISFLVTSRQRFVAGGQWVVSGWSMNIRQTSFHYGGECSDSGTVYWYVSSDIQSILILDK